MPFAKINIELETSGSEELEDIMSLLNLSLPYIADNVVISSHVEED